MAVSNVSNSSSKINMNSTTIKSSGLVSGLDTETLVKQMTALTKSRINAQKQKSQLLQWKQESYRSVISKISAFKDTYFNTLQPSTNLNSIGLFAARAASSTNSAVKVSASSSATNTTYNISNIVKKATTATLASDSKAIEGIKLDFSAATEGQAYKVNVTLDGQTKEIAFNGGADAAATQANFVNAMNTKFSSSTADFSMTDGRLVTTDTTYPSITHTFSIAQVKDDTAKSFDAIGLKNNVSSSLTTNTKLGDVAFKDKLNGDGYSFEINDVKFTFDKDTSVQTMMDTINNSSAGVKLSFESLSGKFKIEATQSGAAGSVSVKQTSGNLLSVMFGSDKIAASSTVSTSSLRDDSLAGIKPAEENAFTFAGGTGDILNSVLNSKMDVTVNGVKKTIGLWSYNSTGVKNDFTKSDNVIAQLNNELKKAFGTTAPQFSYDETAKTFSLGAYSSGDVISVSATTDTTGASEKLVAALGFNSTNSTNEIPDSAKLSDLFSSSMSGTISFGGSNSITLDNNTTVKDLVDASNGYVKFDNGKLVLTGVNMAGTDTAGSTSLASIFGHPPYNYPGIPPAQLTSEYTSTGENGIITVNGVDLTSSSNSYTIDGTTIDVSALDAGATSFSVTTSNDSSKAVDAVKKFVDDYNSLISNLRTEIDTARPTSDGTRTGTKYDPLTEEQEEDMSSTQIDQWNQKAKIGMLYQDSTIDNFLSKLRSAVGGLSSSGISLSSIGITTSSNYKDNGKLTLDETKLRNAFNENPEGIQKLFTDATDGIATKVTNVIDGAIKSSVTEKGSLVMIAGIANTTSATENTISKQLDSFQKLIDDLQTKYKNEQSRYWNQFTNLETTLSKLNSQSSWLSSQFSTQ